MWHVFKSLSLCFKFSFIVSLIYTSTQWTCLPVLSYFSSWRNLFSTESWYVLSDPNNLQKNLHGSVFSVTMCLFVHTVLLCMSWACKLYDPRFLVVSKPFPSAAQPLNALGWIWEEGQLDTELSLDRCFWGGFERIPSRLCLERMGARECQGFDGFPSPQWVFGSLRVGWWVYRPHGASRYLCSGLKIKSPICNPSLCQVSFFIMTTVTTITDIRICPCAKNEPF